jgi:hypothetical protein
MRKAFLLKSTIIFSVLILCFLTYGKISYSTALCEMNLINNPVNKVCNFNKPIEKAANCTYPFDDLLIKI